MIAERLLSATCRLQLHAEFGFADVARVAGYLRRLGVSHVYASPILQARPGSTHGYDVADPTRANGELGGEDECARMIEALHEHDLGLILDIVPNHMGTGPSNPYWEDLLAHGEASAWARWFDIGWSSPPRSEAGRVHLAVLGDELDAVLARGELTLKWENARPRVAYFDNSFPLDPATLPMVLRTGGVAGREGGGGSSEGRAGAQAALKDDERSAVDEILHRLERLPAREAGERGTLGASGQVGASGEGGARGARRRAADELLNRLGALVERSPAVRELVTAALEDHPRGNEGPGRMRALLDAQPYRLAFWRTAPRDLNYRRFFDINELAALRAEDPEVFAETHQRVLGWIADGSLDGIRIDHIDGLLDPVEYLRRLRDAIRARGQERDHDAFPIFVEKILSPGEQLRERWPVQGTTGYEFLNDLEAVFVDPVGHAAITRFYARLTGLPPFADVAYHGKQRILRASLATDVTRLARLFWPLAQAGRRTAGLGRRELREALIEMIACLPVYRTYVDPETGEWEREDRAILERAARRAIERGRVASEAVELILRVFLHAGDGGTPDSSATSDGERTALERRLPGGAATEAPEPDELRRAALAFIARFQQTSGPATAKGVEDTALYQHHPLASLNEVGGEPERPLERAVEILHHANAERARRWPKHLLCTNTHDTKRSADVRARLDVLSEIPDRWENAVLHWRRSTRSFRTRVRERMAPDANTQYLLFQTLVGVWPLPSGDAPVRHDRAALDDLRSRVTGYMQKATREAKTYTSWTDPDEPWEAALGKYIDALFGSEPFLAELEALVAEVALPAISNALSRTLVHLTSPGTPDLYQGDELWNFALVDPDNRRPVDFEHRSRLLQDVQARRGGAATSVELVRELIGSMVDGRIKLHLVSRVLHCRRERARVFQGGDYHALRAEGPKERHVLAFARHGDGDAAITIATRLPHGMSGASRLPAGELWEGTRLLLPAGLSGLGAARWRCQLTGVTVEIARHGRDRSIDIGSVLSVLPVSLLTAE